MTKKKIGFAVPKGADVVHKLTGKGTAKLGKSGSTITLSGTIGVEDANGDIVSMFAAREANIELYGDTNPSQTLANEETSLTTAIGNAEASITTRCDPHRGNKQNRPDGS